MRHSKHRGDIHADTARRRATVIDEQVAAALLLSVRMDELAEERICGDTSRYTRETEHAVPGVEEEDEDDLAMPGAAVDDFLDTVEALCDDANEPFRLSVMTVDAATAQSMGATVNPAEAAGDHSSGTGGGGRPLLRAVNPLELSQIATELSQQSAGVERRQCVDRVTVVVGFGF